MHLVLEGSNLELVEQCGLTGGDLFTFGNNLDRVDDFDLTFNNLGLNVKSLEERSLLWVHTSGTGWDCHISRGEDADLGGGFSNLRVKNVFNQRQITVGEDHTSVQLKLVLNELELGTDDVLFFIFGDEDLDGCLHKSLK